MICKVPLAVKLCLGSYGYRQCKVHCYVRNRGRRCVDLCRCIGRGVETVASLAITCECCVVAYLTRVF